MISVCSNINAINLINALTWPCSRARARIRIRRACQLTVSGPPAAAALQAEAAAVRYYVYVSACAADHERSRAQFDLARNNNINNKLLAATMILPCILAYVDLKLKSRAPQSHRAASPTPPQLQGPFRPPPLSQSPSPRPTLSSGRAPW